jgi:hypothetical protein
MKKTVTIFSLLFATSALFSQSTRTALLEVSESTITPSNTSVICAKEDVRSAFSEDEVVILAQHYNDVQNDPLFQQFSKEWALSLFVNGFTVGGVDRVSYNGNSMVLNPSVWVDTIAARINRPTDALVTLPEVLYDANVNQVYARVQVDFSDSSIFNRELRFFCYLVQDGVEADQYLAIDALEIDSNEIPDCNTFALPHDTLDSNILFGDTFYDFGKANFKHNDVAILNPSTYEGTDGIIWLQTKEGNRFNSVYTFAKPAGVDLADCRIVAFVANYSNADVKKNELINAAQKSSFTSYDSSDDSDPNHPDNPDNPNSVNNPINWLTAVKELENIDFGLTIRPNPVNEFGVIDFNLAKSEKVSVSIFDINGNLVKDIYTQTRSAGAHKAAFSAQDMNAGVYFVRLQTPSHVAQQTLVVVK